MAQTIINPFPNFVGSQGLPLNAGSIYIGVADQDPEAHPIDLFWDEALTVAAVQPIRALNGYFLHGDGPGRLWAATQSYSLRVRGIAGEQVLDAPSVTGGATAPAAPGGADTIAFIQAGTRSLTRTVEAKLRERMSTADKRGTFLEQLRAVATDLDAGGCCLVPRGAHALGGTFTFTGNRLILEGDGGPFGSTIIFDPGTARAAIVFDRGAAVPLDTGGVAQAEVRNLGFFSNDTAAKTAIKLVNAADCRIRNIGMTSDGWKGDSIGVHSLGRQFLVIEESALACARPIVCAANAVHPSLAVDHLYIDNNNLVGTSATRPVLEFESGVSFANTKIWNSDFAGGKEGILWDDTSSTSIGFNLEIMNCRFEQGLDATAFAIDLQSTVQSVQNALFKDNQFGGDRNGVRLRNFQRVTMINCQFNQSGKTALDIAMVAGGRLELINCSGAGAFTISNGRRIVGSLKTTELGFSETWEFDTGLAVNHALSFGAPIGGQRYRLLNNGRQLIVDRGFTGLVAISVRDGAGAIYHAQGNNNAAVEYLDPAGGFSNALGTASQSNFAFSAGGRGYMLENKTGAPVEYVVTLIGSAW